MSGAAGAAGAAVQVIRGGEAGGLEPGRPGPRELVAAPGATIALGRTPPGGGTGWHHHGDRDTYVYVLEGGVRVDFGPGGREHCEGQAGDLLVVPPRLVHRETNAGPGESAALIMWVGTGDPLVRVDGPDAG